MKQFAINWAYKVHTLLSSLALSQTNKFSGVMFSTEGSDFFKAAMKGIRPESYLGHFRTRGPWALKLCLRTNLAIDQSSRSYTYTLFYYPRGWGAKLSLSSLYGQRFYEIRAESLSYWLIFKITIFGHETWPKLRKLNIYSLSIPGG